jgi:hypothetical protein
MNHHHILTVGLSLPTNFARERKLTMGNLFLTPDRHHGNLPA